MEFGIFVTNEHHKVLESPAIANIRRLREDEPLVQYTLVNFDSHPDMGIPEDDIDIGTWIIPLILEGSISQVIFVTHFAHKSVGSFTLKIGKNISDGTVKIIDFLNILPDDWKSYFNAVVDEADILEAPRIVTFHSVHVTSAPSVIKHAGTPMLVSVDLDFFDVINVFFREVDFLPRRDQFVFQYLTFISNCNLKIDTPHDLLKESRTNASSCISCEYVPLNTESIRVKSESKLRLFVKSVDQRLNTMPQKLLDLLTQGSSQPNHPTRSSRYRTLLFPQFEMCMSAIFDIDINTPVVVAESRAYRSDPHDNLLQDVLKMISNIKMK